MQRIGSYVATTRAVERRRIAAYIAGFVFVVAVVAGIGWAMWTQPLMIAGSQPGERGSYKFAAIPVGADGPLKPCVVCHSIEAGGSLRVAPPLHGIVGARKARADWYGYSPALRKAGGNWTEADLDKFLASPSKFLPGTSKTIVGISNPKQRADIIAALKSAP